MLHIFYYYILHVVLKLCVTFKYSQLIGRCGQFTSILTIAETTCNTATNFHLTYRMNAKKESETVVK